VEAERQGVVIHPKYFGKNNAQNYNLGRVAVHEVKLKKRENFVFKKMDELTHLFTELLALEFPYSLGDIDKD